MRAAVAIESAGVPAVSIVCRGFEKQARATGRGLGFDGMRLAVLGEHVDTQSYEEMVELFLAQTVDEVVDGLVTRADRSGDDAAPGSGDDAAPGSGDDAAPGSGDVGALDIVVRGTVDDVNRQFADRGWSDGNAIVPPTVERVHAFLDGSGHDPFRVIGAARPSGRDMTVWSVAVNAVMANCDPQLLPVLLALTDVLADPAYGVEHSGNTTGADALIVVSGPSIVELGFTSEGGALREGTRSNATVGRWLRLYLRNVCGFTADEHDKATFGNAARVVLAEHEPTLTDLGWSHLADELAPSSDPGADRVAVARINSSIIVGSVYGGSPSEILPYLANGLVRVTGWELTHVVGLGSGDYRPLLVLSPLLARIFGRAGWSKGDVSQALFEHARIPAWQFEAFPGAWTNLTAGRRRLFDLAAAGEVPPVFAESDDPHRLVPIVADPAQILVAVAGDPNRGNAIALSNDGRHGDWTVKPIDRSVSTDLACRIDRPDLCP